MLSGKDGFPSMNMLKNFNISQQLLNIQNHTATTELLSLNALMSGGKKKKKGKQLSKEHQ